MTKDQHNNIQEVISKIEEIRNFYQKGSSLKDILNHFKFKINPKTLRKIMIQNNISIIHFWNKGLTKNHPKIKKSIQKGSETQKINGKSKGYNNAMFGKPPPHSKAGFRKDLNHYVRSSWEANFARILKYLNIYYEYEKYTFFLKNGHSYTPDFYIPNKNKFYEIKGYARNNKYLSFIKENPNIKIVIINEKFYNKLIKLFSNKIIIEDNDTFFTKEEVNNLFLKLYSEEESFLSVSIFMKKIGIHQRTIEKMFGSMESLKIENQEKLREIDKEKLKIKFLEFISKFKKYSTYIEFKNFYPKFPAILYKVYKNHKISFLIKDLDLKINLNKYKTPVYWTENEDIILKKYYKNIKNLYILLPNRSKKSIKHRLSFFKLLKTKNKWTEDEILLLEKIYSFESKEYILEKIKNKNWKSIQDKASRLKIKRNLGEKNLCREY